MVVFTACGAQNSTLNHVINFGDILEPYYKPALDKVKCDDGQDIRIPIFTKQNHTVTFQYGLCTSDAESGMVDFSYKSNFLSIEDYVFGKYKFLTPELAFKINPNAEKYTYLDIPIFGITKLGEMSPKEYIKNKKTLHNVDWGICEIKKRGEHIWELENSSFAEVPAANYTINNYVSLSEWKLNHEADEAAYKEQYGDQILKNRACANEQHYWYVVKDDILITLPNPASFPGGVNPTTIIITDSD